MTGQEHDTPFLDLAGNTNLYRVAPNGQAWLIDPFGTPYAYFSSQDARGS